MKIKICSRLIGPFALAIFYLASVSKYTGTGPLWIYGNEQESEVCLKTWRFSLLMLNTDPKYIVSRTIIIYFPWKNWFAWTELLPLGFLQLLAFDLWLRSWGISDPAMVKWQNCRKPYLYPRLLVSTVTILTITDYDDTIISYSTATLNIMTNS